MFRKTKVCTGLMLAFGGSLALSALPALAQETQRVEITGSSIKRIDAETSDYYVLGFYSSNPDPLRRTRRIEVVTKRDGVKVWSRTSYSLRPTPADTTAATKK